jgi:hypothetical protein
LFFLCFFSVVNSSCLHTNRRGTWIDETQTWMHKHSYINTWHTSVHTQVHCIQIFMH